MLMKDYLEFVKANARFATHSGIELLEASEGYAKARMATSDYHLNSVGMVHGGAIFTLADFACAVAANSYGEVCVGLNVDITYVKAPAAGSVLQAEAREVTHGPRIGTYTVRVSDEQDHVIAILQTTTYRKGGRVTPEPPMELPAGFVSAW